MAKPFPEEDASEILLKVKNVLDTLLPLFLLLTVLYLYIEFFVVKNSFLYSYKPLIQNLILVYFLADIIVLFWLYEDNKSFFKNHWLDIVLTVPFLTAFKGLKGLKLLKSVRSLKIGKALKFVKISQKIGKIGKKSRKLKKKLGS